MRGWPPATPQPTSTRMHTSHARMHARRFVHIHACPTRMHARRFVYIWIPTRTDSHAPEAPQPFRGCKFPSPPARSRPKSTEAHDVIFIYISLNPVPRLARTKNSRNRECRREQRERESERENEGREIERESEDLPERESVLPSESGRRGRKVLPSESGRRRVTTASNTHELRLLLLLGELLLQPLLGLEEQLVWSYCY